MQTDLYNYQDATPGDFFKELHSQGYFDGCKASLLKLLWDCKSHHRDVVKREAGSQYNARILELRREGWNIICERGNGDDTYYRLISQARRV